MVGGHRALDDDGVLRLVVGGGEPGSGLGLGRGDGRGGDDQCGDGKTRAACGCRTHALLQGFSGR